MIQCFNQVQRYEDMDTLLKLIRLWEPVNTIGKDERIDAFVVIFQVKSYCEL